MESCTEKDQTVLNILSEKQLQYLVGHMSKPDSKIVGYQLKSASELGKAGLLGDHYRLILCVNENNLVQKINLFIKAVPRSNKLKADKIAENHLFKKEALIFTLLEEIQDVDCQKPWCTKPIIYNDNIIVMPDLSIEGYKTYPKEKCFDRNHVLLTVLSLARFHADFANYFTKKLNKNPPANLLDEYRLIVTEHFWENSWLRAAAKLTTNILKEFSSKSTQYSADLEDKLFNLYIKGSDSLKYSEDSLNVIIHRDLWANNILFKYNDDVPINALLIDFQLIRYAPPAFDLMTLLYLTTSRSFRDSYEEEILRHYYTIFLDNVDDLTKRRLKDLTYDCEAFLACCEKARLFALLQSVAIFPFVLMEPNAAQETLENPDMYLQYMDVDRSEPVLAHAKENGYYRVRQLEVSEEIVERYIT